MHHWDSQGLSWVIWWGNTSAVIQFLFSDSQELSPMDDEKDPHYCSFLITQAPSSSCLHGKAMLFTFLHFSAGSYAGQSHSVHLLLPKSSSKIHPGKGRRGEGPSVSSCCLAMPCPAELHHHLTEKPVKQHCFTYGPWIWRSKYSPEWSINYYFQPLYALPGSDMWYPGGIINFSQNGHHSERRKGEREGNSLATYKELQLFLYSTPFSP